MQKAGASRVKSDEEANVSEGKSSLSSGGSGGKQSCVSNAFLSRKSFRLQRKDEREFEELETLTRHTWNICRVSPLFGFEETEARLKLYAMYLRSRFAALNVEGEIEYKAEFVVVKEGLKTENDSAIKVQVKCRKEGELKLIYVGFLLSWGSLKDNESSILYDVPILVYKGQVRVKQVVHDAIQKLFDCSIIPYILTQNDFMWLNSVFVNASGVGGKGTKIVKITLRPPWKSGSHTEYKIILSDIRELWKRIHSEDSEFLVEEEVGSFFNALIKHAHNQFKINLESFKIDQITYPDAGINAGGKVRCKSIELWDYILSFFYTDFQSKDVTKMSVDDGSESNF